MPEQPADPDTRFNEFWRNRHCLDDTQWLEFYRLVHQTLRHGGFPALASLPESRETYINQFFADRILLPAKAGKARASPLVTMGYLIKMFRHYLNDQLDEPWRRQKVALPEYRETGAPEGDDADTTARDACGALAGVIGEAPAYTLLQEHGLRPDQFTQAAEDFLAGRPPWDDLAAHLWWIQPYLARHFCADEGEALVTLARRLDIPSYHYKAQKLGITSAKGGFPDVAAFGDTYLGQWLSRLGIDLTDPEAPALVREALQQLCQTALSRATDPSGGESR